MVRVRVGDENRREVSRLHLDLREVVEDFPPVGVRGRVDEDEAVVDEQGGGRIRFDDMHTLQEFHRLAGMRSPFADLFLSGDSMGSAGPRLHRSIPARVGFLWPADLPTAGGGGWSPPSGCAGGNGPRGGPWGPPRGAA